MTNILLFFVKERNMSEKKTFFLPIGYDFSAKLLFSTSEEPFSLSLKFEKESVFSSSNSTGVTE